MNPTFDTPMVSIRLMNYNYGRFLEDCVASILQQTFTDFEIVLLDDASTDGSQEIAHRLAQSDLRISLVQHEANVGFVGSLLDSMDRVRGRYEMQMDADDWLLEPEALGAMVEKLESHPEASFCFSPYAIHDAAGAPVFVADGLGADGVYPGEEAIRTVVRFAVPHSGTLVRMSAYREVGGYDPSFAYGPDMHLFYSLCAVGSVAFVGRPLVGYRSHGTNMSATSRHKPIIDDSVRAVEEVFAGPLGGRIAHPRRARRAALRAFAHHHPTQLIFRSEYKAGWRTLAANARVLPAITLLHPTVVVLAARTVLGPRGYDGVRTAVRRLLRRR